MILQRKKYRPEKLFNHDVVKYLFVVHEGKDDDPMDSDTSDDDDGERMEESKDDNDIFITTGEQSKRKVHKQMKQRSHTLKKRQRLQTLVGIETQVVLDFNRKLASTSPPTRKI
jgi:hypothetical protein